MKTRIIYPKDIWFSKELKGLSITERLLCLFLVTNDNIGLTRFYRQPELEICFVFSISESQLKKYKENIQAAGLFLFYDEWVYINNDFSYCDYEGNDRVISAKEKELKLIPQEILTHFEGVVKGLIRGQRPHLNHKPKIINHKSKTINHKYIYTWFKNLRKEDLEKEFGGLEGMDEGVILDLEYSKALDWLASTGKNYKDYKSFFRGWLRRAKPDFRKGRVVKIS